MQAATGPCWDLWSRCRQLPPGQEMKLWLLPDPCICLLSKGCSW